MNRDERFVHSQSFGQPMRSNISTLELSVFFFWDSIPSPSQWKKTWVFWDSEWRIKNIDSLRFSTFSAADLLLMRTPMVPSLRDSSKNTQKLRFCDSRFLNLTHLYSTHIFVWELGWSDRRGVLLGLVLSCLLYLFSDLHSVTLLSQVLPRELIVVLCFRAALLHYESVWWLRLNSRERRKGNVPRSSRR